MVNCYAWYTESERPPFVIPNIVRNLAREKNEILRFALNDKLIVNCQWLIVMRGTRRIMKLIVNCQWSMVMRGTRRIMYLENNN